MTTLFNWVTTAPHPWKHSHTHGADAGQVGWKLHAIPVKRGDTIEQVKGRVAFCGTRAKHGWGLDLFINERCSRCDAAMARRTANGETFAELTERRI